MLSNHLRMLLTAFCAFIVSSLMVSTGFSQGVTTAAIHGVVTDKAGKPVEGATVTVIHVPSGTRDTTITRANGQYNVSGLRVGGPFAVSVQQTGLQGQSQQGISLGLGENQEVNLVMSSEVVVMEAVNVAGSSDPTFGSGRMGNTTQFNATEVAQVVSIRQDIQDLANLDSRINLQENTSTGEFQMSAQGQNFRYNSFLIEGVQANDTFGLNGSGTSSWRSPIPLDAIESFSVDFTPYDVRRSGFTGALLDATIKSGTNDFHGSVDYRYTGSSERGPNPVTLGHEPFNERSYTATFGGPIVPNKLFFFLAYDNWRRNTTPPAQNFVPDASAVAAIVAAAQSYGYNPGAISATSSTFFQKTYLGKLDWNINDSQHAKFTYRKVNSSVPQFANYNSTFTTSFSNYWYQSPRLTDSYTLELDSNWTSNFHTEATASYTKYNGSPVNNGTPFPEVEIGNVPGTRLDTGAHITSGDVYLGTEFSRQLNQIFSKEKNAKLYGDYSMGPHTITFGGDVDRTSYVNDFVQAYDGSYLFNGVPGTITGAQAFQAGTPITTYQDAALFPGFTLNQAFAKWSYTNYGVVLQDNWRPTSAFNLVFGLRMDDPYTGDKPPVATGFSTAGFSYNGRAVNDNTVTNSGNSTVAPRLGFSYEFPAERKTVIRGGAGLFVGTNPAVWLSNDYSMAGAVGRLSANNPSQSFVANPAAQPPIPGTPATPVINTLDPNFKQPTSWKGNLAFDHELPFLGLIFTAEVDLVKVQKAPFIVALNLLPITTGPSTLPDGRIRYQGAVYPGYNTGVSGVPTAANTAGSTGFVKNAAFNNVLYLTDTNKGGSQDYTLQLHRAMKNNWDFSLSYTHEHATEVNPFTSSVAASNFSGRAYTNPNENVASLSNYDIPDKIVVTTSRQFHFFPWHNTTTTLSGQFIAQTGHPFSWTYKGDANGDGVQGNDLLYVPTGPNDPKVAWNSTGERDAFFAFVKSTDLSKYMGQIVPRNSSFNAWDKTVNLTLSQEIPVYGRARVTAFVQCQNFANLLNKNWGIVPGQDFPYERRVVGTAYNPAGNNGAGQYTYFFNSNTLDGNLIFTDVSRWQVLIGARIDF